VTEITSVVHGEVKKQKGAFNFDLFELKLDFLSELESFVKDVLSVIRKHQQLFAFCFSEYKFAIR
jgi:3-dehydroquinate dehydratase